MNEEVDSPKVKSLQLGLDILLNNDLRDDINKINHRTLLIVGDMDRLTPKSASMWLESHLKKAQLKKVPRDLLEILLIEFRIERAQDQQK